MDFSEFQRAYGRKAAEVNATCCDPDRPDMRARVALHGLEHVVFEELDREHEMTMNGTHTNGGAPSAPRMTPASVKRGATTAPMRVLLYGPEGIGKTTFGAESPAPIFVGTEDGFGLLDVARFPEPRTWRDVTDALLALEREKHDYRTLVLDSLDWLEPLVWAEVCRTGGKRSIEDFGYGKGYVAALDTWRVLFAGLDRLRRAKGMHVVLLAHAKLEAYRNPEGNDYDRWGLKIHKLAAGLAKEWPDAVLFANFTGVLVAKDENGRARGKAVGTPTRTMFTERRAAFEAKNRYALPPELPLSWPDFEAAATALRDPAPVLAELEALAARAPDDTAAKVRAFAKEHASNYPKLLAGLDRLRALVPAAPAQTDTPDQTE